MENLLNSDIIVWGNTLGNYIYALIVLMVAVIVFRTFQFYILRKLKKAAEKTETDIDDTLIKIVQSLRPPFYYFLAFYFSTYYIVVSDIFKKVVEGMLFLFIVYQIIVVTQILIDYVLEKWIDKRADDMGSRVAMENIGKFAKFIVWVLGLLLILSNLGINVTSLIAGLGVGGVAIAFALKEILADLFSSFAIYFDKPFKIGDFIKIGNDGGTVVKIGIMTTRLQTPQGEELVMSNQELISSRVQNFKKMEERRGLFTIGVAYETPVEKLRAIPSDIKSIIESVENIRFDRAHFKQFDDSALTYEIVFYVNSNDYASFMDAQQEINLKIVEKFREKGIEMAYPTRTVFYKNSLEI